MYADRISSLRLATIFIYEQVPISEPESYTRLSRGKYYIMDLCKYNYVCDDLNFKYFIFHLSLVPC